MFSEGENTTLSGFRIELDAWKDAVSRRPPHRISLRLTARLLRLPLKGGVIGPGSAGVPPASCSIGFR